YQGQLKDGGMPATGKHCFRFTLHTAQTGGDELGSIISEDKDLSNGLFTVQLDFGPATSNDQDRWLEVAVRPGGGTEPFSVLSPRQRLTPTPYAIFAQQERWSLIGVPVGFSAGMDKGDIVTDKTADHAGTDASNVSEQKGKSAEAPKGKVSPDERSNPALAAQ